LNYDEKDAFLEGYGLAEMDYQKIANAVRTLNILNYAEAINPLVDAKDNRRLARIRARINGGFDLFNFE
jgi:hypothetical protein